MSTARPGKGCRPSGIPSSGCGSLIAALTRPWRAAQEGGLVLGPEGRKHGLKTVSTAETGVRSKGRGVGGAKSGRRGGRPRRGPLPTLGPAPTWGRTKGRCTRGGAGAWGGRRARTWVSAASSAAPSAAPAATKMARSGNAGRQMSHGGGGGPPELLPGQVRPGRRRQETGAGSLWREHQPSWDRARGRGGGLVAERPGCGRGLRGCGGSSRLASLGPRWLPWRPPARARPRPRPGNGAPSPASRATALCRSSAANQ